MNSRTYTVTAELEYGGVYARDVEWVITCDVPLNSTMAITMTRVMYPNYMVSGIEISEPEIN